MMLKDNPEMLKRYAEMILAMKKALGYHIGLTTLDTTYPVQSAAQLHARLMGRGISDEMESAFSALMCETELEWAKEYIPPIAQAPMYTALLMSKP